MGNYLELARRALENAGWSPIPAVSDMTSSISSGSESTTAEEDRGTATTCGTCGVESGISWPEWKAAALNRLFEGQGVTGEPGRITPETVRHGEGTGA